MPATQRKYRIYLPRYKTSTSHRNSNASFYVFNAIDVDSSVLSVVLIAPLSGVPSNEEPSKQARTQTADITSDPLRAAPSSGYTKTTPSPTSNAPLRRTGSPESKRFEQLKNADASRFDPSAAARLGGQRFGPRSSQLADPVSNARQASMSEQFEDIGIAPSSDGTERSTDRFLDDISVVKSQFYVYRGPSADDRSVALGYVMNLEPSLILNGEIRNDNTQTSAINFLVSGGYPVVVVIANPEISVGQYASAFADSESAAGVENAWTIVISNQGSSQASMTARLDISVEALRSVAAVLTRLPPVDVSSRVLVGFGAGAHTALSTAHASPNRSLCVGAIGTALRMGDIVGSPLRSTGLDIAEPGRHFYL